MAVLMIILNQVILTRFSDIHISVLSVAMFIITYYFLITFISVTEHEDEDEDEDEDGSYYSGSDYPLISNDIMFKCPDEYQPISFIKYDDNNNNHNQYHYRQDVNNHNDDDTESLNGLQTDWNSDESDESDIDLDETEQRGDDDEDEDEFKDLVQEWNHLRIKCEEKDKIVNDQRKELNEMRIRFENKCKECEELRQKLRILSGDSEPNE